MKRTPLKRKARIVYKYKSIPVNVQMAVWDRAKGCCEICGSTGDFRGLRFHHKDFKSQGGDDTEDNLILVCGKCHSEKHGIREV